MRQLFAGQLKRSDEEYERVWGDSRVISDTNVLLNLYRYSAESRDQWKQIFESLGNRLWIPHQVAAELCTNRLTTIEQQIKLYDNYTKKIDELLKGLLDEKQHPFIDSRVLSQAQQAFRALKNSLKRNQSPLIDQLNNDPILEWLCELFDGQVGPEPNEDELKELHSKCELRYDNLMPPGYRDRSKEGLNKYGDAILWLQILDRFQSCNPAENVILITDDGKDDWWLEAYGRTIGPRPELIKEFYNICGGQILIYNPSQFLVYAQKYLDINIEQKTIRETRRVSQNRKNINVAGAASEQHDFLHQLGLFIRTKRPAIKTFENLLSAVPKSDYARLGSNLHPETDVGKTAMDYAARSGLGALLTFVRSLSSSDQSSFFKTMAPYIGSDTCRRILNLSEIYKTDDEDREFTLFFSMLNNMRYDGENMPPSDEI